MARLIPDYLSIHMVGDSFTVGLYATTGHEYRTLLKASIQALNPLNASTAWTLIAADGALMSEQAAQLSGVFGAQGQLDYDLLIIAIGQNDASHGHTTTQFRADTVTCLDYVALKYPAAQVVVVCIPQAPWSYNSDLGNLWNTFSVILKEEATSRDFYFVAGWQQALTLPMMSAPADVPTAASAYDGYHPNNTGHQALHDALWRDLRNIMAGAPRRRGDTHLQASGRTEASGRAAA